MSGANGGSLRSRETAPHSGIEVRMRPLHPLLLVLATFIILLLGRAVSSCAPSHGGGESQGSAFLVPQAPAPSSSMQVSVGVPTGLSYADNPAIYHAGRAIPTNTATVSGSGPF